MKQLSNCFFLKELTQSRSKFFPLWKVPILKGFLHSKCKQEIRFFFQSLVILTLLHSEGPKLHRVLAILSAIGLMKLLV